MAYIEQSAERDLQNALNKVRAELNHAIGQRDLWNGQIMQLEQQAKSIHLALTKTKMDQLRAVKPQSVIGVTEAIRTVMRKTGKAMTAQEIRMSLNVAGFDIDRFKNPAAAIANTLIRMVRTGELIVDPKTKAYSFVARNAAFYGDLPNFIPMNTPAENWRRKK